MSKKINLNELFVSSLCTFKGAKKAKAAGFTCANTYFAYEANGELCNAGWMEELGKDSLSPAINIAMAIVMLEDTDLNQSEIELSNDDVKFTLKYGDDIFESTNLPDLLIELWIKYKR